MRLQCSSCCKSEGFFCKLEGFFRELKLSSEEAEGSFRRVLGSYTHRFPKHGEASLTDLPGLRLRLPSCVCNGKVEQQQKGFRKCTSFFKDVYRMLGSKPYHVVYINWGVNHKYKLEDTYSKLH